MGQTPVSDVFSGQGADLLYVLAVCQNRVEICLIQLPVSHHEIVDGFTVAVIQITIEFGVLVYNALAAEKFCVVRLVIRLAALLEKRLFQIYRLCLGSCALPAVRVRLLGLAGGGGAPAQCNSQQCCAQEQPGDKQKFCFSSFFHSFLPFPHMLLFAIIA